MAWPGGKDGAGVYQRLINQIPPHDIFVSAFLGDCAILRRKLPAATSIGVDLDADNIERWRQRAIPGLRLYRCCGIEWLRHAFDLHLAPPPDGAAAAAAGESGGDGHPRPEAFAARFDGARSLVYLDPPYLLSSRRSDRRLYRHELTAEQHAELLDVARRLPCQVMVSHYPHPVYEQALAGWRTFRFRAMTRGGRLATEQVWCNYPEPAELHDARFVGGDKRERERVRRRVRNWVGGLQRMAPAERQAVLDAIRSGDFARPS